MINDPRISRSKVKHLQKYEEKRVIVWNIVIKECKILVKKKKKPPRHIARAVKIKVKEKGSQFLMNLILEIPSWVMVCR